nr:MAG TPA: hypothetical protein [Caudoviricetes sp.]
MIDQNEIIKQLFDQRSQLLAMFERRMNTGGVLIDIRSEIEKVDRMIEKLLADERMQQTKK